MMSYNLVTSSNGILRAGVQAAFPTTNCPESVDDGRGESSVIEDG